MLKQPAPAVYPGGDCGACCIAGLLGITVDAAYDMQDPDERSKDAKDKPTPFGWRGMSHALEWRSNGLVEAVVSDTPFWPTTTRDVHTQYGFPSWQSNLQWIKYIGMALHGGYYGLCSVSHDGSGPLGDHDHWVMLCGIREETIPHKTMVGAGCVETQLLISCSSKSTEGYWIDHLDMLQRHGGYNVILARPASGATRHAEG